MLWLHYIQVLPNSRLLFYIPLLRCVSDFHCPEVETTATVTVSYDPLLSGKAVVPGTTMKIHCAEGMEDTLLGRI